MGPTHGPWHSGTCLHLPPTWFCPHLKFLVWGAKTGVGEQQLLPTVSANRQVGMASPLSDLAIHCQEHTVESRRGLTEISVAEPKPKELLHRPCRWVVRGRARSPGFGHMEV